jgi:molecular chaperone HtpG
LGLADRLMRTEAPFFRVAHTTRIIWGGHRVIYILQMRPVNSAVLRH